MSKYIHTVNKLIFPVATPPTFSAFWLQGKGRGKENHLVCRENKKELDFFFFLSVLFLTNSLTLEQMFNFYASA